MSNMAWSYSCYLLICWSLYAHNLHFGVFARYFQGEPKPYPHWSWGVLCTSSLMRSDISLSITNMPWTPTFVTGFVSSALGSFLCPPTLTKHRDLLIFQRELNYHLLPEFFPDPCNHKQWIMSNSQRIVFLNYLCFWTTMLFEIACFSIWTVESILFIFNLISIFPLVS